MIFEMPLQHIVVWVFQGQRYVGLVWYKQVSRAGTYHYVVQYLQNVLTCPWWRHQIETFSALLAICAGNSPVSGEFPAQRPVTRSFDVFSDFGLNKRLSKQSWGGWFETSLWRHRNAKLWYCFWHTSPHMASQKAVINWSITRRVSVIKSIDRYPPIPAVTGFVSQTLTSSLLRAPTQ